MNSQASLFVIVFTVVNIAACLWLLWWTARMRDPKSAHDDGPAQTSSAQSGPAQTAPAQSGPAQSGPAKTGHVWDGDLEEYNNPLPRWWLWLFVITVIFGAFYLALYPGLGNYAGTRGWTQVGQLEAEIAKSREQMDARLASFNAFSLEQLAADPRAMATAANLFGANCSTCHGSDARGAKGFPNLTDSDWLWGGAPATVQETIANGRHGVMPAMGDVLGPEGVNEVASYVLSLSGVKAPHEWVEEGKERFMTICAACHGADAHGNPLIGAPNLTDHVWLHGGDFASVHATISKGRDNQMPAHREQLGEAKVRLLAAYVISLGAGSSASASDKAGQQAIAPVATVAGHPNEHEH